MKKLWAVLLSAALVSFSGCASESGGASGSGSSSTENSVSETASPSAAGDADASQDAASGSPTLESIRKDGKLIMGTNAEFWPFEYIQDNEPAGVDIDIASEIAKDLGVELVVENMEFTSALNGVQTGKVHMAVAGISVTDERKKSMDFSKDYIDSSQYVIIVKGSGVTVDSLKEPGKIIGVQEGTTGDTYATEEIKGDQNTEEVARFKNAVVASQDLANGKCDAVVIDKLTAERIVAENAEKLELLPEALSQESYAIAVKKGDQEFIDTVNKTIDRLQSEEKIAEFLAAHTGN